MVLIRLGFREKLLEILNILDNEDQLPFPVTWDAAHVLNLGKTTCGLCNTVIHKLRIRTMAEDREQ